MKVLDLFAGTGSATKAFVDRGHDVAHVELEPEKCGTPAPIIARDIRDFTIDSLPDGWKPDHIHASPPCQGFAVPSIGRMWEKDGGGKGVHLPKHPTSRLGLEILGEALRVIQMFPDATYSIENPTGMMRRVMPEWVGPPIPVSYCQYGPLGPADVAKGPPFVRAQKPTDFWMDGRLREQFDARRCLSRPPRANVEYDDETGLWWTLGPDGQRCHEKAERGSIAGVQRIKGAGFRSTLPYPLSEAIAIAREVFE